MRKTTRFAILLAGAVTFAGPAMAFDWTGVYAGFNVGYGFAGYEPLDFRALPDPLPSPPFGDLTHIGANVYLQGFFGGIQMGAQKQFPNNFVLGLENDFEISHIMSPPTSLYEIENDDFLPYNNGERYVQSWLDWFGTMRVRLGFSVNNTMPYVTAGLAYGKRTYEFSNFPTNLNGLIEFNGVESDTTLGYVIGGGVEQALSDVLSVKFEYQRIVLGPSQVMFENTHSSTWAAWQGGGPLVIHTVRTGINVHF